MYAARGRGGGVSGEDGITPSGDYASIPTGIHCDVYTFPCMQDPYVIEIEPEVRLWLMNLSDLDFLVVEHAADLLLSDPTCLGEPHSRYLGDGVRELRFDLGANRDAMRIPYWLAPGRRVVLLTVFRKTRQREEAEVARAKQAKATCAAEHGPAHGEFHRAVKKGDA